MRDEICSKIEQWEKFEALEPSLKKELAELKKDEPNLLDAFSTDIAFGTGGLRGILGVGSNRMNIYVVEKTTLGFVHYLQKKFADVNQKGIVISYDCRRRSREFAMACASVIATCGVKAYIFESISSTPELSFSVRYLACAGGIMITASHNPPKYNGYKVYDELGCQLVPDLAEECIEEVNAIEDMFHIPAEDFETLKNKGLISWIGKEIDDAYLEQVKKVTVQSVEKSNIKIVYTPLHGTGSKLMVPLLRSCGYDVTPVDKQMVADSEFSTLVLPNPEEASAFNLAKELGNQIHADILIATDPDADRMGIAAKNDQGEYVLLTGNQTGAILLNYLAKYKKIDKQGVVYNTIVTSDVAKAICEKYGLRLEQTLTGFKFIGDKAKQLETSSKEQFFFGYEESYGYVIKDFVRDKDSHQATLLLAEVASFYKSMGKTLVNVLDDIYQEFGYYQEGVSNIALAGVEGAKRINRIMTAFEEKSIPELCGRKIQVFEDYEKGLATDGTKTWKLSLPKSFVLKYVFENGGWFVLRPSGTEPKLKIYIAIREKSKTQAECFVNELKQTILSMIDEIK
jgi:phosphoglucomutase